MLTTSDLMTFEEYLAYDDGTANRYELVDGQLVQMNPPKVRHFLIADFLDSTFKSEAKRLGLPWLCFREAGVRTGWKKSRVTDVCVVTLDQARELLDESAVFQSAPQLVVEIVSPESVKRDYRYKRSEYAAIEIPEYWIVDPQTARVTVLRLEEGLYEESVFTGDQQIISSTFPELAFTVEQVLASGEIG